MHTILAIGRAFDWISPTLGIIMNVFRGPSFRLLIPQACGWTGGEIVQLLRRHGIATWGHMIFQQTFMISVKQTQARWAEYVLTRAGVPVGYAQRDGTIVYESPSVPTQERPRTNGTLADTLKELGDLRII